MRMDGEWKWMGFWDKMHYAATFVVGYHRYSVGHKFTLAKKPFIAIALIKPLIPEALQQ